MAQCSPQAMMRQPTTTGSSTWTATAQVQTRAALQRPGCGPPRAAPSPAARQVAQPRPPRPEDLAANWLRTSAEGWPCPSTGPEQGRAALWLGWAAALSHPRTAARLPAAGTASCASAMTQDEVRSLRVPPAPPRSAAAPELRPASAASAPARASPSQSSSPYNRAPG